jgi:ankyrin repeat protein
MGAACSVRASAATPPSPQLLADSQALLRQAKTMTAAAFDFDAYFLSALERDAAVLLFSLSPGNRSSLLHRAARERDSQRLELLLRTLEESAGDLFERYWGWRVRRVRRASATAAPLPPPPPPSPLLSSSPASPVTPRARPTAPSLRPVGSSSSLTSSVGGAGGENDGQLLAAEIAPVARGEATAASSGGPVPDDEADPLDWKDAVAGGGGGSAEAAAAAAAAAEASATEEGEGQERDEDDDENDPQRAPATPPRPHLGGGGGRYRHRRRSPSPPPPPPPSRPPLPPPPRDPSSPAELVSLFLDARNRRGQTALALAARAGDAAAVRRLLRAGASPFVVDRQGRSPLHMAAQHGHAQVARVLLDAEVRLGEDSRPVRVGDAFVVEARSPLFEAALERLAAAAAEDDDDGTGAVSAALSMLLPTPPPPSSASPLSSSVDVAASAASWLLPPHRRVRFVDLRTTSGFSALHHAAFLGHAEVAAELLAAGASVGVASTNVDLWSELPLDAGSNALHAAAAAAAGKGARMAAMLLRAHAAAERRRRSVSGGGGDVAPAPLSLTTPDAPWWQAWERDPDADPRLARTSRGETPSMLAAARDHAAAAELLSPSVPALWMGRRAQQQLLMLRSGVPAASFAVSSQIVVVPPLSALAAAALRAHLRQRLVYSSCDGCDVAAHENGGHDDDECGVCLGGGEEGDDAFTARRWASLSPCRHRLCAACVLTIVEGATSSSPAGPLERPPRCPFCRSAIAGVDVSVVGAGAASANANA